MTKLLTLIITLVLGCASAVPVDEGSGSLQKRQGSAKGKGTPKAGGFGGIAKLLGEPSASKFTLMAC